MPTTETLDELQLERLDWLKVDVSVAALDVLAGASETLWRLRPRLFLAAADEATLRELARAGARIQLSLLADGDGAVQSGELQSARDGHL